jgi:hypothetical protein
MSTAHVFAETCQDEFGLCPMPRRRAPLAIHLEDHTPGTVAVICDRCGSQLAVLNSQRLVESVSYLWLDHVCTSPSRIHETPTRHAA